MIGPSPRVFLTGVTGAGKTCAGRRLADALGWRFVDLDAAIEAAAGQPIAAIFASEGEQGFRAHERAALSALLAASGSGEVVALGGGAYVQEGVAELLAAFGPTVFLDTPAEVIAARLSDAAIAERPLLSGAGGRGEVEAALSRLLAARRGLYERAEVVVDGAGSEASVVLRVLSALSARGVGLSRVEVPLGDRAYPIWVGQGGVGQIGALVGLALEASSPAPGKVAVVTDDKVAGLYLDAFVEALGGRWPVVPAVVPQGEGSKDFDTLKGVWGSLLEARLSREDVVVALGGGVIGDLAGFAAATLLRGVRLVQVPTTLLSQVDSSVGGKTGINHPLGKNLIGAFHQPVGVVIGMGVLRTLDPRQVRSGLAEIVKAGLIEGEGLLGWIERDAEAIARRPWEQEALVAACCAFKARIVAEDEREGGRRALLNLGHTFGHAIEAMEGFGGVTHGEAVGLGMVLAARAARLLIKGADAGLEGRLTGLLTRLELPTDPAPYLGEEMVRRMKQDKKASSSTITLVLPGAVGAVALHPVDVEGLPALIGRLASEGSAN